MNTISTGSSVVHAVAHPGPAAPAHPDPAFPALHPRPAKGWLNDPNGICFRDGRWHVFFQHNPESARHSSIAWGHISSKDLLRWNEEPVALRPQQGGPDAFGCWTGVMADDDGVPTAVYSGVKDSSGSSRVTLARGTSDLSAWRQDGETAAGMPDDPLVTAVRDPFLFTYRGGRFAIQGAGLADGRGALLLYNAVDLAHWEYLGIWLTTADPVAAEFASSNIWECPQIVEVDGRWLVIVSLWLRQDEHHHLSGVGHLIGSMHDDDAGLPVFVPEAGGRTDEGPDFYAPQLVALEDRAVLWGWSWESRSDEAADAAGWAGLLTFPRELNISHDRLVVTPARELVGYRRRPLEVRQSGEGALAGDRRSDEGARGDQEIDLPSAAEAVVDPSGDVTVALMLVSPSSCRVVYSSTGSVGVRVFVDASIVEVYREGFTAATLRAYPDADESWVLKVTGDASVDAWELGL